MYNNNSNCFLNIGNIVLHFNEKEVGNELIYEDIIKLKKLGKDGTID